MNDKSLANALQAAPVPGSPNDLRMLLARIARSDRVAFKALYEQTSARLFSVVKRITRNHALAEEVLQDVYLRVWEKASSYDETSGAPSPWLASIARNRAIDAVRSQGERLTAMAQDDGEDILMRLAAPAQALEFAELDGLRKCLSKLDELHCRCIVLAYCSGFSREELAVRFDRSVGAVKTWLHRGLTELRACLEDQ